MSLRPTAAPGSHFSFSAYYLFIHSFRPRYQESSLYYARLQTDQAHSKPPKMAKHPTSASSVQG